MTAREKMLQFPTVICRAGSTVYLSVCQKPEEPFEARLLFLKRECAEAVFVEDLAADRWTLFRSGYEEVSPEDRPPISGARFVSEPFGPPEEAACLCSVEVDFKKDLELTSVWKYNADELRTALLGSGSKRGT